MSTAAVILIATMTLLLILGAPIGVSRALSSVIAISFMARTPMIVVPQRMFTSIDSFPFMAIPFFVLAGEFMLQGGLSKRLVNLAEALMQNIKGGLALVSIVTCAFFGAISGSALATTAAIGGVMYPEMKNRGYKEDFSATVQAAGGTLGILIPPSIPLVVYGVIANVSIANLFLAIIGAGVLMALAYCIVAYYLVSKDGMASQASVKKIPIGPAFFKAFWGLLSPIIILGGIYTGVFTPTESAIVATVYSLIVGRFIYRELDSKNFIEAIKKGCVTTAGIMFIIAAATHIGRLMTALKVTDRISNSLLGLVDGPIGFLLLINFIFLIAGMFMETASIILLTVPLLLPVAVSLGVDPIHFGIISVTNLSLGLITPPFGASLFVASGMSGVSIMKLYRRVLIFLIGGIVATLLVTYVPTLTIGLLTLFGR